MSLEPPVPPEVMAAVRAPFTALDAAPIDVPVMQPLGILLDLAGEAMRARLFVVQSEGGEEACLRPDFSVPVAQIKDSTKAALEQVAGPARKAGLDVEYSGGVIVASASGALWAKGTIWPRPSASTSSAYR